MADKFMVSHAARDVNNAIAGNAIIKKKAEENNNPYAPYFPYLGIPSTLDNGVTQNNVLMPGAQNAQNTDYDKLLAYIGATPKAQSAVPTATNAQILSYLGIPLQGGTGTFNTFGSYPPLNTGSVAGEENAGNSGNGNPAENGTGTGTGTGAGTGTGTGTGAGAGDIPTSEEVRADNAQSEKAFTDWMQANGYDPATQRNEALAAYERDYARQLATYGKNAEALAQAGLTGSGYSDNLTAAAYAAKQSGKESAMNAYQQILTGLRTTYNKEQEAGAAYTAATTLLTNGYTPEMIQMELVNNGYTAEEASAAMGKVADMNKTAIASQIATGTVATLPTASQIDAQVSADLITAEDASTYKQQVSEKTYERLLQAFSGDGNENMIAFLAEIGVELTDTSEETVDATVKSVINSLYETGKLSPADYNAIGLMDVKSDLQTKTTVADVLQVGIDILNGETFGTNENQQLQAVADKLGINQKMVIPSGDYTAAKFVPLRTSDGMETGLAYSKGDKLTGDAANYANKKAANGETVVAYSGELYARRYTSAGKTEWVKVITMPLDHSGINDDMAKVAYKILLQQCGVYG